MEKLMVEICKGREKEMKGLEYVVEVVIHMNKEFLSLVVVMVVVIVAKVEEQKVVVMVVMKALVEGLNIMGENLLALLAIL